VNFLLVLIELFSPGVTAEASEYHLKIGDFALTGTGWAKISGRRCRPHQPYFFSENKATWSFV